MKKLFGYGWTAYVLLAMLPALCGSCRPGEMEEMAGTEEGLPATIRLEVRGEEEVDVATRTVNEDVINDMHILIYNAGELIGQKYKAGGGTITVDTRSATGCNIYVIANTGNENLFKGYDIHSESTLKNMVKTVPHANTLNNGTNLPMTGSRKNVNISAGANSLGTLKVTRMVAKINLNIKAKENSGITISEYIICNVPFRTWYVPRPLSTEAETKDAEAGEDAASPDNDYHWTNTPTKTFPAATTSIDTTFYMFENRRGVKEITQQKDKNTSTAPKRATYVYIKGKIGDVTAIWRVYLGANNTTNFNIKRNREYTCNITLNDAALTDTRIDMDFTNVIDLTTTGTANCYLLAKRCTWYKFKATVRGNGAATAAEISPTGSALTANAVITPASAELVWETGQPKGIIQSVSLTNDKKYVLIKTGHLAEGNAVVAVKGAAGNILWSWHIWKTAFDLDELNRNHTQTYRTNPRNGMNPSIYYNGISSRPLKMMDRDLGAADNTPSNTDEVTKTFGLYYQFGRKDPFPTAKKRERRYTDNNSEIVDIFDKDGNKLDAAALRGLSYQTKSSNISTSSVSTTISYAIKHPLTFIVYDSSDASKNWIYGARVGTTAWKASNQLWGGNLNNESNSLRLDTKFTKKTIYDPCPQGWCLPPQDTWTNFTTTLLNGDTSSNYNINISNLYNCPPVDKGNYTDGDEKGFVTSGGVYGRRFYIIGYTGDTAFHPASGYRIGSHGQVYGVGAFSNLWSSSPTQASLNEGGCLSISINSVFPVSSAPRANAYSVRCVQEASLSK